ncbi:MAG: hypothetical protein ACFFDC_09530 [Promethearchaeota archaeon]
MAEIDISLVVSFFALFISTIHIVCDKWLDKWLEKRERTKIREKLAQKIMLFNKKLIHDVNKAELPPEDQHNYLRIINEKFVKLTPILLNATYSVEKMKELECNLDQFFLDRVTELGARIEFKTNEEMTEEE